MPVSTLQTGSLYLLNLTNSDLCNDVIVLGFSSDSLLGLYRLSLRAGVFVYALHPYAG